MPHAPPSSSRIQLGPPSMYYRGAVDQACQLESRQPTGLRQRRGGRPESGPTRAKFTPVACLPLKGAYDGLPLFISREITPASRPITHHGMTLDIVTDLRWGPRRRRRPTAILHGNASAETSAQLFPHTIGTAINVLKWYLAHKKHPPPEKRWSTRVMQREITTASRPITHRSPKTLQGYLAKKNQRQPGTPL